MTKILGVVNIILAAILVYILVYPQIQAGKQLEAQVMYMDGIGALPLYVAEDKGFFDTLRITVTADKILKRGEMEENVGRGVGEMAINSLWPTFLFKAAGRPEAYRLMYSVSSSLSDPYAAILTKSSRIKKLSHLAGKRIGILQESRDDDLMRFVLTAEGVTTEDISFLTFGVSEIEGALLNDMVDVLVAVEPFRSRLLANEDVRLVEDAVFENRLLTPYPFSCTVTSIANLELKKKEIQRLHGALDMAVDYIRNNPDSAAAVVRTRFGYEDTLAIGIPDFRKYDELNEALLVSLSQKLVEAEVLISETPVAETMLLPAEIR
jgi:ABC-type nitrate/sulfonate/bicarbonate transport system substrate-binding protein